MVHGREIAVRDVVGRNRDQRERRRRRIAQVDSNLGKLLSIRTNNSKAILTLNHDVLPLPEIFRAFKNAGVDECRILPGLPFSPIITKVDRVAEAIGTESTV